MLEESCLFRAGEAPRPWAAIQGEGHGRGAGAERVRAQAPVRREGHDHTARTEHGERRPVAAPIGVSDEEVPGEKAHHLPRRH
jgi:hypothetical protein